MTSNLIKFGEIEGIKAKVKPGDFNRLQIIYNQQGNARKLLTNLRIVLENSEMMRNIGFNSFTHEITLGDEVITDGLLSEVRLNVDRVLNVSFSKDDILDVLNVLGRERNTYHPIKRMIESKDWDGIERAERVFIDYLGAEDTKYTRAITKKWLAGAAARIYEPGKKMEIVPILQGRQGIGKSTIAARLGGDYFIDSLASLGNTKDDYQLLIGAWIVELSELSSVNTTQVEKMKGFISAQFDKIRLPYGRVTESFYRTCVFIGTTNNEQFLNDLTGNRRFFPIPLVNNPSQSVFKLEDGAIQQIWAEAYILYKNGEKLFLEKEDEEVAELYRSAAMEENLFHQSIEDYLNMNVPKDWNNKSFSEKRSHYGMYKHKQISSGTFTIDRTTTKELAYVMGIDLNRREAQSQTKKINLYMDNLQGWRKTSVRIGGRVVRGYKKG